MSGENGDVTIRLAESAANYAAFGRLCRSYLDWSRDRYRDMPWFVEEVFGYQSLDAELQILPEKYGPPKGRTMVAVLDGEIVGAGAWRRLSDTTCELKRLYVADGAKGHGLGRRLTETLMASARAEGFTLMQLDTGHLLKEAIALYETMGFRHIPPYQTYPDRLMPYLVFMEKAL